MEQVLVEGGGQVQEQDVRRHPLKVFQQSFFKNCGHRLIQALSSSHLCQYHLLSIGIRIIKIELDGCVCFRWGKVMTYQTNNRQGDPTIEHLDCP